MLYNKVILPIENELKLAEEVFDRYIGYQFKGGIWVPNERFPLDKKQMSKYKHNYLVEHMNKGPYLPFLCIPSLKDWLLSNIYWDNNQNNNPLFSKNYLMSNAVSFNVETKPIIEEFLPDSILESNITDEELKYLESIFFKIYDKVKPYTSNYPDNVFDLELSGPIIYLVNKGEIGSFRYNEYLNYKNINKR